VRGIIEVYNGKNKSRSLSPILLQQVWKKEAFGAYLVFNYLCCIIINRGENP